MTMKGSNLIVEISNIIFDTGKDYVSPLNSSSLHWLSVIGNLWSCRVAYLEKKIGNFRLDTT